MKVAQGGMIETVQATIKRYHMLPRGSRVGVAVSGGADSVALLHMLLALSKKHEWQLEVLHLNHQLRGQESSRDMSFVKELASSLGIPCLIESDDVAARGGNVEEAARMARREFFERVRAGRGLDRIATGHTLDDQAETVLFRIVRGSGISGLQGILPVTREKIVRPLLDVTKGQIRSWMQREGIGWVEDSTNLDTSLARNAIRHEILPWLERSVNRRGSAALARLASVAQDEEAYWEKPVAAMSEELFTHSHGAVILNLDELVDTHRAVCRRLIRRAVELVTGGLYRVDFEHVESVVDLMTRQEGEGSADLPGAFAERSLHYLRISPRGATDREGAGQSTEKERLKPIAIHAEGAWIWSDDSEIRIERMPAEDAVLRCWARGDKIRLAVERPAQSLHDLFQKARIPRWERTLWPVLESNGVVVWTRRFGLSAAAGESGWVVSEASGYGE